VFRFIAAKKANYPISLMCRVLGVSRSGFHAWLRRHPSKRWVDDVRLAELIHQIHSLGRRPVVGGPRRGRLPEPRLHRTQASVLQRRPCRACPNINRYRPAGSQWREV
jgi:hypothetical protein